MSQMEVTGRTSIKNPPPEPLSATDWGDETKLVRIVKHNPTVDGRRTTTEIQNSVTGDFDGNTKGGTTLSETLLLLCNKNMIGLAEFQGRADESDETTPLPAVFITPDRSDRRTTITKHWSPNDDKTNACGAAATATKTMYQEPGGDTLAGNHPEDPNLLLFEPFLPLPDSFDDESACATKNGDKRSSKDHPVDVDVAVVVVKKRKRGKDLSCMLHRRAKELEAKEASFDNREATIESKAQALLQEIKRQDCSVRRRERMLLNRERNSLAHQINVQEMQKRLWLDRQESSSAQADDDCFICFERTIDCVLVPCGHLVACLDCATKLKGTCCICNQRSKPQKIYRTLAKEHP
jgi:hypothetical protein